MIQQAFQRTQRIHVTLDTREAPPVSLNALVPSSLPENFATGSRVAIATHMGQ